MLCPVVDKTMGTGIDSLTKPWEGGQGRGRFGGVVGGN